MGKSMNFSYTNRVMLEQFDASCIQYGKSVRILTVDCPALRLLYDALAAKSFSEQEVSRRIALAMEIKLSLLHTYYDLATLAGIENENIVPELKRVAYIPLEDHVSFALALRRSRTAFALVTRIRSLWDKLFIYVVMTNESDDILHSLDNAKSKRRFFFKRYKCGVANLLPEEIHEANNDIKTLDEKYRTPELHGYGSIRGWVFDTPAEWGTPYLSGNMAHWNMVSKFAWKIFEEVSSKKSSFD